MKDTLPDLSAAVTFAARLREDADHLEQDGWQRIAGEVRSGADSLDALMDQNADLRSRLQAVEAEREALRKALKDLSISSANALHALGKTWAAKTGTDQTPELVALHDAWIAARSLLSTERSSEAQP